MPELKDKPNVLLSNNNPMDEEVKAKNYLESQEQVAVTVQTRDPKKISEKMKRSYKWYTSFQELLICIYVHMNKRSRQKSEFHEISSGFGFFGWFIYLFIFILMLKYWYLYQKFEKNSFTVLFFLTSAKTSQKLFQKSVEYYFLSLNNE